MMIILQLVLCLMVSLSNVCFASDYKKMLPQIWEIGHISKTPTNPYYQVKEPISGKLQIYHVANDCNYLDDNPQIAARFMPSDGVRAAIEFSNFNWEKHQEIENLENRLNQRSIEFDLSTPLYILRGGDEQWGKPAQVVEIKRIEKLYESKKLLDIREEFKVVTESDSVYLRNSKITYKDPLCHPDNIENIRQALSCNKQFIVLIKNINNNFFKGKIKSYKNNSYIQWKGWIPSFKSDCVGTPIDLDITDKPGNVFVDLEKEKEELHHYSRNKWISRSLMAAIIFLIAYKLKDKIYNVGLFLTQ